ncbi:MAG: ion transporter [Nitrospinota bacterium]
MGLKERIGQILDPEHIEDSFSRTTNVSLMVLIFLNVLAVILETVQEIGQNFEAFFTIFEYLSVLVFSIEYILRLWTCDQLEDYKSRFNFALTPMAIIDLIAILPFYLPFLIPFDLRFLRVLRLVRVFRLIKLAKYSQSMKLLGRVFLNKKEELVITLTVAIILLVMASSVLYFIENKAQPEVFTSIPAAMWWSIGATTRLGVGAMNPVTEIGMLFGSLIALLGLGVFALPAGILASGLVEEMQKNKVNKN